MTDINTLTLVGTANHKVVQGLSALFSYCFRIISLYKGAWNNETMGMKIIKGLLIINISNSDAYCG